MRAAWDLIERDGPEVSLAEIAAEAGVSRQALYLHFGSRAGLLTALVRHHAGERAVGDRFTAAVTSAASGAEAARAWIRVWLDYLPEIVVFAAQLATASTSDTAAREALDDRMENQRAHLTRIFEWAHADGALRRDLSPTQAAETLWSLVHVTAWQQLVVECGWTPAEFEQSRLALLDHAILT